MRIVIRADASEQIGSGHIMRCLTLADELRAQGAGVFFICRELPGNNIGLIEKKGYAVFTIRGNAHLGMFTGVTANEKEQLNGPESCHLPWMTANWPGDAEATKEILKDSTGNKSGKVEWLVVDHYALDRRWEAQIRPYVKNIMVIDDLANRPHDCDLLLDQNLYDNMESRYNGLVPEHCRKLLGPRYALLRPEFREARKTLRKRDGTVKRILVFFGGADPTNETAKALEAIQMLNRPDIAIDVVVGISNPHQEEVKQICSTMPNTSFYCQADNMAELMAKADLAIGAAGSTTWERCCVGLPAVTIAIAGNQKAAVKHAALQKAFINLGDKENIDSDIILAAINKLFSNHELLIVMSKSAFNILNGYETGIDTIVKSIS